jgi:arginyl-tRNA synthetase
MSTRDHLAKAVSEAVATVADREGLDLEVDPASVPLERPAHRENGDWSTTVALSAAKKARRNPRDLAGSLVEVLLADPPAHIKAIQVAGPGFINFYLDDGWLHEALGDLLDQGENGYARPDVGHGERVQVEFISANPTGPIHVGNGWPGCWPEPDTGSAASTTSTTPVDRSGHSGRACWPDDMAGRWRRAVTRAST